MSRLVVVHKKLKQLLNQRKLSPIYYYIYSDYSNYITHTFSSEASTTPKDTTNDNYNFGNKKVRADEKPKMVWDVFTSVADKYDIMNDIMSAGTHRLWKDYYVSKINTFQGMRHLDVAGGTGDIGIRIASKLIKMNLKYKKSQFSSSVISDDASEIRNVHSDDKSSEIIITDINEKMLENGKNKYKKMEKFKNMIKWEIADGENLPFEDNSFDSYSIAFGIRNTTNIEKVLNEAWRVLKSGGHFSCLEFSNVENVLFRNIYDLYSFNMIPIIGKIVTGDYDSYKYLVDSIRNFPKQEEFLKLINNAGFKKSCYENLFNGVVAIHNGFKLLP